jgi:hypothetical protein
MRKILPFYRKIRVEISNQRSRTGDRDRDRDRRDYRRGGGGC